jgi:hypothetical protein
VIHDLGVIRACCERRLGNSVREVRVIARDMGAVIGVGVVFHDGWRHAVMLQPDNYPSAELLAIDASNILRFTLEMRATNEITERR